MIFPGSTIGMLGGGQLGRMSALAGRRMGYRFHAFDPSPHACIRPVVEKYFLSDFQNYAQLKAFAEDIEVATLEFENVPTEALDFLLEKGIPVRPGPQALKICQNRAEEKAFLHRNGLPCQPNYPITNLDELKSAFTQIGPPAVLKTAEFGYDGKGQVTIQHKAELQDAWERLATDSAVLEKWCDFTGEYSVIVARNPKGAVETFPLVENIHHDHILHTSIVPARISETAREQAMQLAKELAESMQLEGLIAVELFRTENEAWVINELAPRPHNSGHFSFDACTTSQFEQHIRAVCDMPLGSPDLLCSAVMINLLGNYWPPHGTPSWHTLLEHPHSKLHLYDKGEPRVGRKMGHFTLLGNQAEPLLNEANTLLETFLKSSSSKEH